MPVITTSIAPQDAFLRLPQVLSIVGIKKSSWYKLIKDGEAPEPVRLSARCSVWSRLEIDHWVESKKNDIQWTALSIDNSQKVS